jgi:hypothetical protein
LKEGYDLIIRVNPRPDETLIGRAFLHDRLLVVVAIDVYRHRSGLPAPAVVRAPRDRSLSWKVRTAKGPASIAVADPVAFLDDDGMRRHPARRRCCLLLPVLVVHDIVVGPLVHWADSGGPETALWVLYPSSRLLSTRMSAL